MSEEWLESLYSFRLNKANQLEVSKWLGGREPVEMYTIANAGQGKCNCLGSMRQPYCRHKKMVDKVNSIVQAQQLGKAWGCYYDYDKDILYTPMDGEGVPWDMSWMEELIQVFDSVSVGNTQVR